MILRKAKDTDLQHWANLRNQLWPDSLDTHLAELENFFSGRSNDMVKVFVAEADNKSVVGFIELNLRNFAEGSTARFIPYIEGWFVDEKYQNQGIGKQPLHRAEKWALECGFKELASDTEIDNNGSITIHKKLGFKEVERVVCFMKRFENR